MDADQQDNSKVLSFRPRTLTGSRHRKDNNTPDEDIVSSLTSRDTYCRRDRTTFARE
jgi:hypothetical protein